ncbi:hypothetical protein AMTRI_Chr06g175180 [Amborella trichopoda]
MICSLMVSGSSNVFTLGSLTTHKEFTPFPKLDFNVLNFGLFYSPITQSFKILIDTSIYTSIVVHGLSIFRLFDSLTGSSRPLAQIQLHKQKRVVCTRSGCYVLSEERKWVEVKIMKADLRELRIKNVCPALWIGETLILHNWMRYIICNVKSGKKGKLTALSYLIIDVFAYQPNLVTCES